MKHQSQEQLETKSLVDAMNDIMPFMVKMILLIGITVVILSIIIGIYKIIRHQNGMRFLAIGVGTGILISFSAILCDFICHFNFNCSSYKWQMPSALIIGLAVFIVWSTSEKRQASKEDDLED